MKMNVRSFETASDVWVFVTERKLRGSRRPSWRASKGRRATEALAITCTSKMVRARS